jgi:lysozyme family protein
MTREAILRDLEVMIRECERNEDFVTASELDELFVKIAGSKFDKYFVPAVLGLGAAGGLYKELQNRQPLDYKPIAAIVSAPGMGRKLAKDPNVLMNWKKFLEENNLLVEGSPTYDLDEIEATKEFQDSVKLIPDGSLGPQTLKAAFDLNPNSQYLKNIIQYLRSVQEAPRQAPQVQQAPQAPMQVEAPRQEKRIEEPRQIEEPVKLAPEKRLKKIKELKEEVKEAPKKKQKLNIKQRSKIAWDAPIDEVYKQYFPLRFDLEGDVSDWKYDRGGLTKRGITQVVVKKYFPGKKVTDLDNDQLEFIARSEFNRTMRAGLPNNSGVSMADFDFNSGMRHTNTVMRRTLRDMYGIPLKAMMVKGTLMSRVEPERRILEKIIKQRVNSQQEDEKLAEIFNLNRNLFYTQECPGMIVSNPGVLSRPDDIAELTGSDINIEKHDNKFVNIRKKGTPLKKTFKMRRKMLPNISRALLKERQEALKQWKKQQN